MGSLSFDSFQVPTVSQDDLDAFHKNHFTSCISVTAKLTAATYDPANSHYQDSVFVDDLGYYPDGQKRTLTDQQIEMFRFSEVQSLLKMRRYEREREKEKEELHEEDDDLKMAEVDQKQHEEIAAVDDDYNEDEDEDEYMRFLEKEKEQFSRQVDEASELRSLPRFKGGSKTERRMARELDDRFEEEAILDYGDESVTATMTPSVSGGRKRISYDDQDPESPNSKKTAFVWPTIG